MKFGHHICAYEEEIVQALSKLVAIPSVCGEAEPGLPYGKSSAQALACILSMAEEMGFSTRNVENYAGHAEYSCGKEGLAAVLAHVDVVPAGMGWDTDPFTLTRKGNLLFGRGVVDDKGAAIVALYCLKALKDHGVTGKRSIRAIFGAGEEVGMEDLKVYFQQESLPDLAFTPDSDYGICNREKGILHGDFSCGNDSTVVQSFMAGSVVNAVPDRTTAVLRCSPEEFAVLQKNSREMEGEFLFEESPDGGKVVSKGVALTLCARKKEKIPPLICSVFWRLYFHRSRWEHYCPFYSRKLGLSWMEKAGDQAEGCTIWPPDFKSWDCPFGQRGCSCPD